MHASDSGYSRYQGDWTGPHEMLPFKPDPFRAMTMGHRPIEDTMSALVCHGVLARFPELRLAAIENGGEWVVQFLRPLDAVQQNMPPTFDVHPIDQVKRYAWIPPFPQDDLAHSTTVMGTD